MQYILEEANLTDTPDEPKPQSDIAETPTSPEPETAQPETQEQEQTALVSTEPRQPGQEPEVVDGEVVELEPQTEPFDTPQLPKQKPYWLLIPFAIVLCLLFLAGSLLLPILTPSATVLIIPVERSITTTQTIKVHGRVLPTLTLSQSQTTPATGKRHQDATQAQGEITFYNGQLSEVTIAAGTILTGQDGVQIITDQAAHIPPASNTTPPTFGQVTVAAHAIQPGAHGNIPPYDINGTCCTVSILVKNTNAFTGGQNERDYTVVSRQDINTAVTVLLTMLSQSENAALQVQLHPGEALIPTSCTPHVSSDHKAGEEAKHVSVTVSITCSGIASDTQSVYANAMQLITTNAQQTLGTTYIPLGNIQVAIIHTTITNQARGIATVTVKIEATYVYTLTPGEKQHLVKLIAGKSKQQAQALLSQEPGIAGVVITTSDNAATLPENPGKITIVIAERL